MGVLFVNISIGGTLTNFAAPPVLMVANAWGWDLPFMAMNFGWKAALAVLVNATGAMLLFRRELRHLQPATGPLQKRVPLPLVVAHVAFLALTAVFAHPVMFMGVFLLFSASPTPTTGTRTG